MLQLQSIFPPKIVLKELLFNFFMLILFWLVIFLNDKCSNISHDYDKKVNKKISDADWAAPLTYKNNIYEKNYFTDLSV